MSALVTVIIPVYNQKAYLPTAIESVLKQTHQNLELILVDDESSDGSADICQKYLQTDARVRYLRRSNGGQAAARNTGLDLAKGDYILFLDGDDLIDSAQIALQLNVMEKDSAIDIVYSAAKFIDDQGQLLFEERIKDYSPQNFLALMFVRYIPASFSSLLLKHACCQKIRFNENYRFNEDYDLIIRLAYHYRFRYIDLPLSSHRNHAHNISTNLIAAYREYQTILNSYGYTQIAQAIEASDFRKHDKSLLKGIILFYLDQFEAALQILKPLSLSLAAFYQGGCYVKLQRFSEAETCYLTALSQEPTNPGIYNNLGALFFIKGNFHLAAEYFQRALDLLPGYKDAKENLSDLKGGNLLQPRFSWKAIRKYLLDIGNAQMQSSL